MKKLNRWFFLIALSGGLLPLASARAATFTVSALADTNDGVCNAQCSLREAIGAANGAAGDDSIVFAPNVKGTIQLQSALPDLSSNINLQGPGAKALTIRGEGTLDPYRIFTVAGEATVNIGDLTISNGHRTAPEFPGNAAGGIFTDGVLSLSRVHVQNNTSTGVGGAICNRGTLTVEGSLLSGNSTTDRGGAIWTIESDSLTGSLTVSNSTFYGNSATLGGGAIRVYAGTVTLSQNTFVANTCDGPESRGGAIENWDSTEASAITLSGNLFSNNTAAISPDLAGFYLSSRYNLVSRGDGALNISNGVNGDQIGSSAAPINAKLGSLADNGGPTNTCALLSGSPALNAGDPAFAAPPSFDQRGPGFPRVQGTRIDIGAYEATVLTVSDSSVTEANGGSVQAQFLLTLSAPQTKSITLSVKTAPGNSPQATPGADYVELPPTTITFAPGQISKTVNVTVLGDTLDENDEKFALVLSSPTSAANVVLAGATGLCTILDNDAAPILSASAPAVSEGDEGTFLMIFTIKLSVASARNISVQYRSTPAATNPATPGADYNSVPLTTVIFLAGETTKTVPVTINGDLLDEENERVALSLTNPVNATLGTITDGIILDDDATPAQAPS